MLTHHNRVTPYLDEPPPRVKPPAVAPEDLIDTAADVQRLIDAHFPAPPMPKVPAGTPVWVAVVVVTVGALAAEVIGWALAVSLASWFGRRGA